MVWMDMEVKESLQTMKNIRRRFSEWWHWVVRESGHYIWGVRRNKMARFHPKLMCKCKLEWQTLEGNLMHWNAASYEDQMQS